MEAGRMRESIIINSPPSGQDGYGAPNGTWTEVLRTRASFDPLIGKEYYAAQETQSKVEVKFRLRYRDGIQNSYRVSHNGIDYDILSAVNVEGRNRELLLYCKKVII